AEAEQAFFGDKENTLFNWDVQTIEEACHKAGLHITAASQTLKKNAASHRKKLPAGLTPRQAHTAKKWRQQLATKRFPNSPPCSPPPRPKRFSTGRQKLRSSRWRCKAD
ncbi:MAG: hypothetical protein IJS09_11420, partial [Treponema sp.]|nr:hypothetical protein [Treponema sp.]